MRLRTMQLMPATLCAAALTLAACGTLPLADAPETIERVVGNDLPGAQGKTLTDQDRIDSALAGLCSTGVYDKQKCDTHTRASAERRSELSGT